MMDLRSTEKNGRCASGCGGAICVYAAGNRHEQTKPGGTGLAGATWPVSFVANAVTYGFAAGVMASVFFGDTAAWKSPGVSKLAPIISISRCMVQ